jgi:hypothetical protein
MAHLTPRKKMTRMQMRQRQLGVPKIQGTPFFKQKNDDCKRFKRQVIQTYQNGACAM